MKKAGFKFKLSSKVALEKTINSISKKLMHRYNQGKTMFHANYPLFDKV